MVVLLAGGSGFTRREGLRRLKERLENVPGRHASGTNRRRSALEV